MEPIIRTSSTPDGLFWLLLLGLGLGVAARYRDPNRWALFSTLAVNNKYLMVFNRGKLWRQPFFLDDESGILCEQHCLSLGALDRSRSGLQNTRTLVAICRSWTGVGVQNWGAKNNRRIVFQQNCCSIDSRKAELSKFRGFIPVFRGRNRRVFFLV